MKSILILCLFPITIFASMKNTTDNFIIKMSDAILIAQSKTTGKLIESSLEVQNNFLIYSITFSELDKSISEIKIDAGTGNILNIEKQSSLLSNHL